MKFLRARTTGTWRNVPFNPARDWEKTLVMALEYGRWAVNRVPIEVSPGLVVSFHEPSDAEFFTTPRQVDVQNGQPVIEQRGAVPAPELGQIIAVHDDEDALYFVRQGLAEIVSEAEIEELRRQIHESAQQDEVPDDGVTFDDEGDGKMNKPKMENKAQGKPAQTKGGAAPKPVSKGGGKGKKC